MLITTKRQSTILINKLKERIRFYNSKLEKNKTDITYLKNVITSLIKTSIVNIDISFFRLDLTDEVLYKNVSYFIKQQTETDDNSLLIINLKNFESSLLYRINLNNERDKNINLLSKLYTLEIHDFIKCIYFQKSIQVLRGGVVDLGIYNMLIVPFRNDHTGKTARRKIDWAQSIKNKKALIAAGKVPYKQYERDHGIKWFAYHTDEFAHYVKIYKNSKARLYEFENKSKYTIIPFAFVHTEQLEGRLCTPSRIKQDFLDKCESIEDIINCKKLGFVDRLYYLLAFDKDYHLKFKNRKQDEYSKFKRSNR